MITSSCGSCVWVFASCLAPPAFQRYDINVPKNRLYFLALGRSGELHSGLIALLPSIHGNPFLGPHFGSSHCSSPPSHQSIVWPRDFAQCAPCHVTMQECHPSETTWPAVPRITQTLHTDFIECYLLQGLVNHDHGQLLCRERRVQLGMGIQSLA